MKVTTRVIILSSVLLLGCKKEVVHIPFTGGKQPLLSYINENKGYTIFAAALKKTGLDQRLSPDSAYTILMPDNTAFSSSGINTIAQLDSLDPTYLKKLIAYHILPGLVRYSDVSRTLNNPYQSISGQTLYFSKKLTNPVPLYHAVLHINGRSVLREDILTENGIIQVLDSVLKLPQGTVQDFINNNPKFSTFTALCKHFGYYTLLAGSGPITAFIPDNNAFAFFGITPQNVGSVDTLHYVKSFVGCYFIIPNRLFTSDLEDAPIINSQNSSNELFLASDYILFNSVNSPSGAVGYQVDSVFYHPVSFPPFGVRGPVSVPISSNNITTNGVVSEVDSMFMYPANGIKQ